MLLRELKDSNDGRGTHQPGAQVEKNLMFTQVQGKRTATSDKKGRGRYDNERRGYPTTVHNHTNTTARKIGYNISSCSEKTYSNRIANSSCKNIIAIMLACQEQDLTDQE